jgi:CRISPR type III-B/RAMP module-associated protein Cmr5
MSNQGAGGRPQRATAEPAQKKPPKSPETRRASTAFTWVQAAKRNPKSTDYLTLTRKLPSYLQMSGLGQTLAFLYGKGRSSAEGLLASQIGEYLQSRFARSQPDLMQLLLTLTPTEYRLATQELLALADWLKRMAAGQLGDGEG